MWVKDKKSTNRKVIKMKKALSAVLAIVMLFSFSCVAFAADKTLDEGKAIALAHAELTAEEVTFKTVKYDYDDGVKVIEIEFYKGFEEYDYEINAATGAILEFDRDMENGRDDIIERNIEFRFSSIINFLFGWLFRFFGR